MASPGLYYGTQGGGIAVEDENGVMVWHEPPDWLKDTDKPGDPVPLMWGITGPFDENGKQVPIDD